MKQKQSIYFVESRRWNKNTVNLQYIPRITMAKKQFRKAVLKEEQIFSAGNLNKLLEIETRKIYSEAESVYNASGPCKIKREKKKERNRKSHTAFRKIWKKLL